MKQDDCPRTEPADLDLIRARGAHHHSLYTISYGIRLLQCSVAKMMKEKGWSDGPVDVPEKLALIHSEISEALEAYRDGDHKGPKTVPVTFRTADGGTCALRLPIGDPRKPEGIMSELADAVIRIVHLADLLGEDLAKAIIEKHTYNSTRPYRHGGKKA